MRNIIVERVLSFAMLLAVVGAVLWLDDRVGDRATSVARVIVGSRGDVAWFGQSLVTQVIDSFTGDSGNLLPAFVTVAAVLLCFMLQTQHSKRH